jgi:hypothetical protein
MAYDSEKEKRSRWRENNAVGAMAGLMFLGLLLIGALIAVLLAPIMVATVPPPIRDQQEAISE